MATAYGSSTSATANHTGSTDTITINKPTSTTEGDLLVAVVGINGESGNFTSSGWSTLWTASDASNFGTRCLYKVAGASEPASYDFSIFAAIGDGMAGFITRITGNDFSGGANIYDYSTDVNNSAATNHTFTPGITPDSTNGVFIHGAFVRDATGNVSANAITNNNPSWTEREEATITTASNDATIQFATATPSAASATGDFTLTLNTSQEAIGFLMVIKESTNVSVSTTVDTATFSIQNPTISADGNVSAGINTATFSVQDPTISTQTVNWAFESRPPESTWVIENQT